MELIELVSASRLKSFSRVWLHLLKSYFRIEVEGLQNLPRKGRVLILPNHSGFLGADAVLLTFVIKRETRRRARILAHRAYFDFSSRLAAVSESFGLKRASVRSGIEILERDQALLLFPEGESGNFKPSLSRYRLQPFHTGFLRMAIPARAPIVPCLIVGAEETSLSLGNVDLSRFVRKLKLPLPVNLVPLPAKWSITFLPPIEGLDPGLLDDPARLERKAREIQRTLQKALAARARERKYVYFPETGLLARKLERQLKRGKRALKRRISKS